MKRRIALLESTPPKGRSDAFACLRHICDAMQMVPTELCACNWTARWLGFTISTVRVLQRTWRSYENPSFSPDRYLGAGIHSPRRKKKNYLFIKVTRKMCSLLKNLTIEKPSRSTFRNLILLPKLF